MVCGRGIGGREKRGQEAGYPKGEGAGRNGKNIATLAQYLAIGKAQRGGNCYGRGREPGVQGAGGGKLRPPPPVPPWFSFEKTVKPPFFVVTSLLVN